MAEVNNNGILIRDVETKNIMTKSTLPVGGYSVNPYVRTPERFLNSSGAVRQKFSSVPSQTW